MLFALSLCLLACGGAGGYEPDPASAIDTLPPPGAVDPYDNQDGYQTEQLSTDIARDTLPKERAAVNPRDSLR